MAGEWRTTTVGEVSLRVTKGTTPTTIGGQFVEEGINFVKVESITDDGQIGHDKLAYIDKYTNALLSRSVLCQNDILFTIAGTIGRVALVPESILPANTNQAVAIIRPNPEIVFPRYLYYILGDESRVRQAHTRIVQSVQANFSLGELSSLEIPLPSLPEQRAIAHILGTLDDKIELNRRMNETLEAIARALFKSWFVDFDPVRAKVEGRAPGLPKHIADFFPDSFEDSELGEIPKGWTVQTIGNLADVVGGSTPSTKEPRYWDGGAHYWATPKDLSGLTVPVLLGTERRISDAGLSRIGSGLLPKGTVLLSSRAPIGYLAVAEVPVAINQGFIAMKPKTDVSNLFLLLWASVAHEEIISRANGSTFLEISKANFRPIKLIAPSTAVMRAFDAQVRPLYQRIVECACESHTLAALR
ncbi:MAG: restriction endonuclease subunit S, partial [Deltaproteobacteria bacterium]